MTELSPRAWATIDLHALKKNLARVSVHCPESLIVPVIKANAYGHGVERVARALDAVHTKCTAFAVATLAEAMQLRAQGIRMPLLLLGGYRDRAEMDICLENKIEPVVHSMFQFQIMAEFLETEILSGVGRVWVKFNSGMNRLGLNAEQALKVYGDLHRHPETEVVLMSHLASADDLENEAAMDFTRQQIAAFEALKQRLADSTQGPVKSSFAASAGIIEHPATHQQCVRPGIMLYGSSPFASRSAEEMGLLPVMTLSAKIMAINDVAAGETIGYAGTHRCEKPTRVGIVSIGYADGYPRGAKNGTPVLVKTAEGPRRTRLLGRVSMDMIAIDLSDLTGVVPGIEVVLWGEGLPADEVARDAGTIAYELFCKVTPRVEFIYTDE